MRQVVLIGSISVCILLVVLLFKLNKTKIEYDNKLVAINRKVRDLTSLIDLSNTKQNLIKESTGDPVVDAENADNTVPNVDKSTNIEEQYKNFVDSNGNFFDTLDNFNSNIPEEIKDDIDNFVNNELDVNQSKPENNVENENSEMVEEVAVEEVAVEEVDVEEVAVEDVDVEDVAVEDVAVEEVAVEDVAVEEVAVEEVAVEDVEGLIDTDNESLVDLEEHLETTYNTVETPEDVVSNVLNSVETTYDNNESHANNDNNDVSNIIIKLDTMTVKELQDICRENKLKLKGRKDELVERIKDNLSSYAL
tara:strand:+ start:2587 stop:3507 length:921 start_codon:yes stop_codon:yes gene_type:complete